MEKRKISTTARGVDTQANIEDSKIEGSLRPKSLDNYIGQKKIKESLKTKEGKQRETLLAMLETMDIIQEFCERYRQEAVRVGNTEMESRLKRYLEGKANED